MSPASEIDSCLIGRWRQVTMRQTVTVDGARVVVTGWTGRILDFRASGVEIVGYDQATPLTAPNGVYRDMYKGQAVYRVGTQDGVLRFESVDYSRTRVQWQHGSRRGTATPADNPPGPVQYTCSATTHTQRNDFYQATFTRLP